MSTRRIPRWILPSAIGGVLAMAAADAILMRRHPVSIPPRPIPEQIGLHAEAEGDGVRVVWERGSRPVRNADHATLFIEDGTARSQLDLTGRQLDSSSVMYWPESEKVRFRLEVYRGTQSTSDATDFGLPPDPNRHRQSGPARAMVEPSRPSPFERVEPAIVVTQTLPAPPGQPAAELVAAREPAAEPPGQSRLDRVISRIPLLRRFRKSPQPEGNEPR